MDWLLIGLVGTATGALMLRWSARDEKDPAKRRMWIIRMGAVTAAGVFALCVGVADLIGWY